MKGIVLYDSTYGNTEILARKIAETFSEARALAVNEASTSDLRGYDLLIVGSPTQGGRPTSGLMQFLKSVPDDSLVGIRVAAFDTRFAAQDRGISLRILMRLIGYAAPRIAAALQSKGGRLAAPPEGFIVQGKEGPLKAGELERAARWTSEMLKEEGEEAG